MKIRGFKKYAGVLLLVGALSISSLILADSVGPTVPSGDGFYLQWTPKVAGTHYAMVDESTCNGTTDYVSTNTVGNRDSFSITLGSIPNGSKITQIDITPCASRNNSSGGGSSTMNVFYRFNGINGNDAGGYALYGTTPISLPTKSFTGLSLFKGATSTLDIGAVLSAGTRGARLGQIKVAITYTVLQAPSALSATPSGTEVTLHWTDNTAIESGFKIDRSTDGINFTQVTTLGANVTNYVDTSATLDTTYSYRVRAYNDGGNSAYSNTATATTMPVPPNNLVTTNSGGVIVLSWTDNSQKETNFRVERKTGTGSYSEIGTVGTNVTTYVDYPLSGTHTYRVRASNGAGNTGYTNESTITKP